MPIQACKRHDCDLEPRLARIETMVAQVRAKVSSITQKETP
jgi:hypothetical protein